MIGLVKNYIAKIKRFFREERVIRECGCIVYCPECNEILNDTAKYKEKDYVGTYTCSKCSSISVWVWGVVPVPIKRK